MQKVYLVLDKDDNVNDFTTEKTDILYCEIEDDATIEEFKKMIGFYGNNLKWNGEYIFFDSKKEPEKNPLEQQLELINKHNEFLESCLVEIAMEIYD